MKKAFRWMEARGIDYQFHDYKKDGIDVGKLNQWCEQVDWTLLLNKRGLTWRRLPDSDKQNMDRDKAIALMLENTSLIKRPVLEINGDIQVGFNPASYTAIFAD